MVNSYHIDKYQQAYCRDRMSFHAKNVALQAVVSLLLIIGSLYAAQRRSAWAPLILAPLCWSITF